MAVPILLSTEGGRQEGRWRISPLLARGSARSVNQVDLYQLERSGTSVASLWRASLAAGLSLPVENTLYLQRR